MRTTNATDEGSRYTSKAMSRSPSNRTHAKQTHLAKQIRRAVEKIVAASALPSKQVGHARYFHLLSCGFSRTAQSIARTLSAAGICEPPASDLLIKLRDRHRWTLLVYENFIDDPHPPLVTCIESIPENEVDALRVRHYRRNRPVLHRKELLLRCDTTEYFRSASLTEEELAAGLLSKPFSFGYESQWTRRLAEFGYTIEDGVLKKRS